MDWGESICFVDAASAGDFNGVFLFCMIIGI